MTVIRQPEHYDTVIVGGGTMGLSTAYHLAHKGQKVAVIEQYNFDHQLSSSRDYSRAFRVHYGADVELSTMAVEALFAWKEIEKREKRQFYHACGKLVLGDTKDAYIQDCQKTMLHLGQPHQMLYAKELKKRYPFLRCNFGLLDPQGGVLDAQAYLDSMLETLRHHSRVSLYANTRVYDVSASGVDLGQGRCLKATNIVVTAGAWVQKLLPVPVEVTKQQILYFQPPSPGLFVPGQCPVFSFVDSGFYGLPQFGLGAVKIANHLPGVSFDAEHDERTVDADFVERTRDFLRQNIPSLAAAKVVEAKVCLYTGTADRHFLIDKLPDRVTVATGFSGHGFKFSPWVGARLAEMVAQEKENPKLQRFSSQRFIQAPIPAASRVMMR
jgi:monomeric sarcosine oxidase